MSRYYSYLNTAKQILQQYRGEEPFASFLKKFFAADKKYGSRDRKQISHLCYCFFRLGKSFTKTSIEERILIGLFLCSNTTNEILQQLRPGWNDKISLSGQEKYSILNLESSIEDVFPWKEELSERIDNDKFCESFFTQPDLFLRSRPGKESIVRSKLAAAGISFHEIGQSCLSISNATKIENIIEVDREAVVQDLNSQRSLDPLKSEIADLKSEVNAWDCCAGSGGKSLLLYDTIPNIALTVSDIRESILINLKKRFDRSGIKKYKTFWVDLSQNKSEIRNLKPEIIICDAPCTGSGTWSRTPEQLYFFDDKKIEEYSSLQKKITSNAIPQLKNGGYFIYITCSVFKKENEENVDFIKQNFKLQLIEMRLLEGYDKKADSLFVALFKKSKA